MEQKNTSHSTEETKALAQKLAQELEGGTTLCLEGDLGAGKTTFAQGLLEALGAQKPFISPTFVIMKQYALASPSPKGVRRVYHVDAYRVEEKDLKQLGFAEWCSDPEGVVILEWPERAKNLIPQSAWRIHLSWKSETEREITIKKEHL